MNNNNNYFTLTPVKAQSLFKQELTEYLEQINIITFSGDIARSEGTHILLMILGNQILLNYYESIYDCQNKRIDFTFDIIDVLNDFDFKFNEVTNVTTINKEDNKK